uniref:DUF7794 domain-containing protein n=1 Tax=Solanum lycopersicum TaxID=4081 RepID=A0A3Q7HDJ4_SOLLC
MVTAVQHDICSSEDEDSIHQIIPRYTKCSHHYHLSCIYDWQDRSETYVNGELTIPLEDDANFKFQLSKEVDRDFVTSPVSLTHKIQRAVENHQDLSGAVHHPSEQISGKFDGLKLEEEASEVDDFPEIGDAGMGNGSLKRKVL